HDEEQDL
ncbi:hypothetical protein MK382_01865, partial [Streptococcus pneumoniae]|nr:hypothetical protein [Streptococcus pneumoniae]